MWKICGLIVLSLALTTSCLGKIPTILHEWRQVEYQWPSDAAEAAAQASGAYIPVNCVVTGVKVHRGDVYVSVPRWRPGVPFTLTKVVQGQDGSALLQPFPSAEIQNRSSPADIVYVQSMEVTNEGIMYILDVGVQNLFGGTLIPGPPKLVLLDLATNKAISTFVFPPSVASYSDSFLNDLVVDQAAGFVYMTDAFASGGIVVWDRNLNRARRYTSVYTHNNNAVVITINNVTYPDIHTPSDGIALTTNRATLYWCALQGDTLYSIDTTILKDFSQSTAQISKAVVAVGRKPPSDGMAFSSNGKLYFGSLTGNAVYQWDPNSPLSSQSVISSSDVTMQWVDTFAFDGKGNLIFTSNRLQKYFANTLNTSDINFRILSVPVQGDSYIASQLPFTPQHCSSSSGSVAPIGIVGVLAVGLGGLLFGALFTAVGLGLRSVQEQLVVKDDSLAHQLLPEVTSA